ncbi:MAG TPA: hypothetical protein VGG02_05875 [Chthoniobacterales bacterium]|jgi:hypothetical protein
MPPKDDPYATKSARVIDLVLILIALLVMAIAVLTSPRRHASPPPVAAHSGAGRTLAPEHPLANR